MHAIEFIGTSDNKLAEMVLEPYVRTYKRNVVYCTFIEHKNGGVNRDLLQIDETRRSEVGLNYRNTGKVGKPCEDETVRYLYSKDMKRHNNLPLILYGCKTLSLTLQYREYLGGLSNNMLRRRSEPEKEEVGGG